MEKKSASQVRQPPKDSTDPQDWLRYGRELLVIAQRRQEPALACYFYSQAIERGLKGCLHALGVTESFRTHNLLKLTRLVSHSAKLSLAIRNEFKENFYKPNIRNKLKNFSKYSAYPKESGDYPSESELAANDKFAREMLDKCTTFIARNGWRDSGASRPL